MLDTTIDLGLDAVEIPSLLWLVRDGIEKVKISNDPYLNYALEIEARLPMLGYLPTPLFYRHEIKVIVELFAIGQDRNLEAIENTQRAPGLLELVNGIKSKLAALA